MATVGVKGLNRLRHWFITPAIFLSRVAVISYAQNDIVIFILYVDPSVTLRYCAYSAEHETNDEKVGYKRTADILFSLPEYMYNTNTQTILLLCKLIQ